PDRELPKPAESYYRQWDSQSAPVPASGGEAPAMSISRWCRRSTRVGAVPAAKIDQRWITIDADCQRRETDAFTSVVARGRRDRVDRRRSGGRPLLRLRRAVRARLREAVLYRGSGPGLWRPAHCHRAADRALPYAAGALSGDAADLLLSDLSGFLSAAAV